MFEACCSLAHVSATKSSRGLAMWLCLTLAACGGGGSNGSASAAGGGGAGPTSAPTIVASVFADAPANAPPWKSAGSGNATASVAVKSAVDSSPITTATVRINGADVGYNPSASSYISFLTVAPGDPVSFAVTANGASYSASSRMPTEYPTIVSPADGATWSAGTANTIAWTMASPVAGSSYGIAVFDRSGRMLWPANNTFLSVAPPGSSITVPAGALSPGAAVVSVGILNSAPIVGAGAGSAFGQGGTRYVSINVGT